MGIRFVTPDTETLPLSDGDSVRIKKRLSHGERDEMFTLMRAKPNHMRSAELVGYLVGWSSPIPYELSMSDEERLAILNGLDPDSFDEIAEAVKTYLEGQAQEKKLLNGAPASSATSTSLVGVAGAMSG